MKVTQNGQFVKLDSVEDWSEAMSLRCICGAALISHEHGFTYGSRNTIQTGSCKHCNCKQFSVKYPKRMYGYA